MKTTSLAGGNQQLVAFLRRKKSSTSHVFLPWTSSTLPNHEVFEENKCGQEPPDTDPTVLPRQQFDKKFPPLI